jgi:hypothetical protein
LLVRSLLAYSLLTVSHCTNCMYLTVSSVRMCMMEVRSSLFSFCATSYSLQTEVSLFRSTTRVVPISPVSQNFRRFILLDSWVYSLCFGRKTLVKRERGRNHECGGPNDSFSFAAPRSAWLRNSHHFFVAVYPCRR